MKVSLISTVYNEELLLEEFLYKLLHQLYKIDKIIWQAIDL